MGRADERLSFPPFAIELQRRRLTREGEPVDLSPHLVEILAYLAGRPGQTVSKDELLDRFWPDVHVSDNTVARAIADIRKGLDDPVAQPRFIQTVARRGYRFIGEAGTGDASRPPATDDAFAQWSEGRLSLETLDAGALPRAVAAFERAVAATPDYAPAHAGLANAYFLQYELTRSHNVPNREALDRAARHVRRACELDPSLGEAWATLGFVLSATGDVEQARAAARRATALEPTSWRHHFRLAMASWGEERLRAVDRTLVLMPDFAPARFLAAMVFVARQAFGTAAQIVAKGADRQHQQTTFDRAPFPAVGLHWLQGLLLLREGAIGSALMCFSREIDDGTESNVYFREFRVNALTAAGYAHLSAGDPAGAAEAFRSALALLPSNGRARLGLLDAFSRTGLAKDAEVLRPLVDDSIAELTSGGRLVEAALVGAAARAARGELDAALAVLDHLLEHAPAGHVGWQLPIDPALSSLRRHQGFERLLARLAARAA